MTAPKQSIATKDHGRWYCRPGSMQPEVPSVTNIKDMLDKPWLGAWVAKVTANYAANSVEKLQPLDVGERVRLIKGARFEKTGDSPSAIGDYVHDFVDRFAKGEQIPETEIAAAGTTVRHTWESFLAFMRFHAPTINQSEYTVWNDTIGYAGTADLDITVNIQGNTHRLLVDTKTGNDVYWDTGLQLAALGNAEYILDDTGQKRDMPKFDGYAILHLRPTFFRLVPVYHIDECFEAFKGLKAAFDLKVRYSEVILGQSNRVKSSTVPV